ncbi:hypothetical protein [Kineosporia sp. A_224]|uniref:hypothetical protein n=1 Tax=Kineosporia sp. A_224 TaxID=1962180 RepID=UPI000B4AF86B|nr:hypothetical protein [Kineosporia sp. A_224]
MSLSDVLDDAADEAVAGRSLDPAAILARAARPEYRPGLRPLVGLGAPRWRAPRGLPRQPLARGLLVAASLVAVATLLLALLPVVQRALPQPADVPSGPGGIPRSLVTPPEWIPTVTERPISRAVYVVSALGPVNDGTAYDGFVTPPRGAWVVGADGGEVRALPIARSVDDVGAVALSPDGRRVAWTSGGRYGSSARVDVVEVSTGAGSTFDLPGSGRRGFDVVGLAFSPDGGRLALWGTDPVAGGRPVRVAVLDVRAGTQVPLTRGASGTTGPTCRFDDDEFTKVVAAWAPPTAEGATLLTPGCQVEPDGAAVLGVDVAGAVVRVSGALPPGPQGADQPSGMGSPAGSHGPSAVVDATGTRYSVTAPSPGIGADDVPRDLVATGPDGATRTVAALGTVAGAKVIGVVPRGVVVSRWTTGKGFSVGMYGAAEVLLVRPDGTVERLTATDVQARVAAVAQDVVASGRSVAGERPGPRVLDSAWWSAVARSAAGAVPRPSWQVWLVVLLGLVGWRLTTVDLGAVRRGATRGPVVGWGVGGLVVLLVVLVPPLLPDDAPRAAVPPGSAGPVLPRTITDQRLVPPRAFDVTGTPRTTAVGIVFSGTVAGRPGLYATDAVTGQVVRLDDLPGLDTELVLSGGAVTGVVVSPNGRYLTDGAVFVDLARALWVRLADGASGFGRPTQNRNRVAVLDDGTLVAAGSNDHRLWLDEQVGDGKQGRVVAGVEDAVAVEPAGDRRFGVRLMGEDRKETDPWVVLVDIGSPGSGATPDKPVVTPLSSDQNALVAVLGRSVVRGGAAGLLQVPLDSGVDGAEPATAQRVVTPGAVDAIWLAGLERDGAARADGNDDARTAVVLGAGSGADLVVSRVTIPSSGDAMQVAELTTIDPAVVPSVTDRLDAAPSVVTVAAEVVARARVVDPPAPTRWWSWAVR